MNVKDHWIIYYTIVRKEISRVLRIWPQTLLPSAITMVLYFLVFGQVIGSRIGPMDGLSYISFIAPGLIIMAVLTNSYANVVGSFFGSRFNHSIQELLVSPASTHLIILGYISGGIARGFTVGIIVSIVAMLFGAFHITYLGLYIVSFLMCSATFSLGGLLNGIFSRTFDDTSLFPTFILTPLIYLGGVFYSISALPKFWQNIVLLNPIFYIVDLFRYTSLGVSNFNPLISFAAVLSFCILLYVINYLLLARGYRLKS
jgi:ABC-2 type transport system permease protein